jgi:hypothetical protein
MRDDDAVNEALEDVRGFADTDALVNEAGEFASTAFLPVAFEPK